MSEQDTSYRIQALLNEISVKFKNLMDVSDTPFPQGLETDEVWHVILLFPTRLKLFNPDGTISQRATQPQLECISEFLQKIDQDPTFRQYFLAEVAKIFQQPLTPNQVKYVDQVLLKSARKTARGHCPVGEGQWDQEWKKVMDMYYYVRYLTVWDKTILMISR